MATTVSYGSISIVDLSDVGEFSIYPKCNLPLSVIYNPDQSGSMAFTPNWSDTNLIVSPSIWYAGNQLSESSTGLQLTWSKQIGVGSVRPLDADGEVISDGTLIVNGETIPKGTLVVNQNKFSNVDTTPMITYIVTATYLEPTSQQTLTSQGEITFSLVKQASTSKTIVINGDSIFKYDENGQIEGANTITLTARYTNVRIGGWEYLNGNTWTKYPNSGAGTTLTVNATDNVFSNNKVIIRLVAASPNTDIYDTHVITKLFDGRAGSGTTTAILTNDSQMIPFVKNESGVEEGVYTSAKCQIIIYRGGDGDVTSEYTITQEYDNIQADASATTQANDTVQITRLTGDTGSVRFTATKTTDGNTAVPIVKTFNVIKAPKGMDGETPTIYSLKADAYVLSKLKTNVFNPDKITFSCYKQVGNDETPYAGMLRIYENVTVDEITDAVTPKHESVQGETSYTYTPSASATSIVCMMYRNGSFNDLLDTQTIAVAMQGEPGAPGEPGQDGEGAINIILNNYHESFTVNDSGILESIHVVTINFYGCVGINRVPTRVVNPQNLRFFGYSYNNETYTNATTTQDGTISFTIPANADLSTYEKNKNGNITLTFDLNYNDPDKLRTMTYDFSWGIVKSGRNGIDGVNAVFVQLGTPKGNIIENGSSIVEIHATVVDGGTDVTNLSTFEWSEFEDGEYKVISDQTSSVLTVTPEMVDSYSSFKCAATYNQKSYTQYMTVLDKHDPVQTSVLSSIGDKLLNGNGIGALYVKLSRNGTELDPIKSERFVETLPVTGNKTGDYIYLLNKTNKTVTLYQYTSSWDVVPENYTGMYEWFYRNKDGAIIRDGDSDGSGGRIRTPATTGKVVYVDGDLVDKKLIADVKVTI